MEEPEQGDAPSPPAPAEPPDAGPQYRPGDALPPQAQTDDPWAFAIGSFDSHLDAWAHALNFTDQHPLSDTVLEEFILGDQWDHLHHGGGA